MVGNLWKHLVVYEAKLQIDPDYMVKVLLTHQLPQRQRIGKWEILNVIEFNLFKEGQ